MEIVNLSESPSPSFFAACMNPKHAYEQRIEEKGMLHIHVRVIFIITLANIQLTKLITIWNA